MDSSSCVHQADTSRSTRPLRPAPPLLTSGADGRSADDMHVTLEMFYNSLPPPHTKHCWPASSPPLGHHWPRHGAPCPCPVLSSPTPLPTIEASESLPYFKCLLGCKTVRLPTSPPRPGLCPSSPASSRVILHCTQLPTYNPVASLHFGCALCLG